jgi:hypothetical protein
MKKKLMKKQGEKLLENSAHKTGKCRVLERKLLEI